VRQFVLRAPANVLYPWEDDVRCDFLEPGGTVVVLVRYALQGTRSDLAFLHRLCGYYSEVMSHQQPKGLLICGMAGPEEARIAAEVGLDICMYMDSAVDASTKK